MCQFEHYLFTTKRHVPIKNKDNMKQPMTLHIPYTSSSYIFFCSLSHPVVFNTTLITCIIKLHFSSFTTNLPNLYNKPLFYNGKKEVAINFHTEHIGINDWIYINLKHIGENMWNDNKTLGISKRWHLVTPFLAFVGN